MALKANLFFKFLLFGPSPERHKQFPLIKSIQIFKVNHEAGGFYTKMVEYFYAVDKFDLKNKTISND